MTCKHTSVITESVSTLRGDSTCSSDEAIIKLKYLNTICICSVDETQTHLFASFFFHIKTVHSRRSMLIAILFKQSNWINVMLVLVLDKSLRRFILPFSIQCKQIENPTQFKQGHFFVYWVILYPLISMRVVQWCPVTLFFVRFSSHAL